MLSGGLRRGRTLRRPRCPVPAARRGSPPVPGGPAGCRDGNRPSALQRWRPARSDPRQDRLTTWRQPWITARLSTAFLVTVPQRPFRRPGGLPVGHPVPGQVPVDVRRRGLRVSPEVDFTEAPFHPAALGRPQEEQPAQPVGQRRQGVPPPGRSGPAVAAPSGDCRCFRLAFSRQ